MNKITKHSARDLTYRFYGPEFMPADEDEGALRDVQWDRSTHWRNLKSAETEILTTNGNQHPDWSIVRVTDHFNPKLVRGCRFGGFVRIGDLENLVLDFEGMKIPVGIYHSTIVSCDIGNNVAIHRVGHLANMLVGNETILHNVGLILTRPAAKFGNGFVWEREAEERRTWMELWNENGGRRVAPFESMLPADAWLWAKYRGDAELQDTLRRITDAHWNRIGVQYGSIGTRTVIRNTHVLLDTQIGSDAVIDGAARIENVTVHSDDTEETRIGEGAELIDGIVGFGCVVGSGARASRFVLGTRARLTAGARLAHSVLGDNSTVAGAEILNCLIFPSHQQNHQNSFLIAAAVQGQCNIAAGATIGSNHNSRAADGELIAGRGFWPGLCTSFKHPSRFAAYTLTAKGDYAAELNVPYPFSLVADDTRAGCLRIAPAWWFLHNMAAVMRNSWKYRERDVRRHAGQHIEYNALAPDTVEEMLAAAERLETLTGRAALAKQERAEARIPNEERAEARIPNEERAEARTPNPEAARALGRRLLGTEPEVAEALEILDPDVENSRRKVLVMKAPAAWAEYRAIAQFYAVRTLLEFMALRGIEELGALAEQLEGERERRWVNLGGQLVAGPDLDQLRGRIASGELGSWEEIHAEYDRLWKTYPETRAGHALAVLTDLADTEAAGLDWARELAAAEATQAAIVERTRASRAKDYEAAARRMTYDTAEEMAAVVGTAEEDGTIARVGELAAAFAELVSRVRERNGLAQQA